MWSRNTHPREFPPENAHAHFGDIIGASHTAQYRVWQEGRVATTGLRRLADDGSTTALEKELKAEVPMTDPLKIILCFFNRGSTPLYLLSKRVMFSSVFMLYQII